ncbi:MAG: Asp-tRNA(Asn)/Glu-tRNA(Gln) amidotransferase subunit GatA [Lachnoclostridium sp.]|nr:Asp-tRNA(Asn)/Glu-tRNA(Gln) amidotransferase subunit GatA [Lachnospira sp.]MCM1248960.1 Asp-tRNA(Asn)/Glu-tRNA(Gln) amidotransferase subunit GatA [Lachnoclostridium sp.]MCM1535172.1 Asp-tRNA(Asn)/Glu-tRNA(Gln) amidotransferase subunit GatA [Clostridium sp.]
MDILDNTAVELSQKIKQGEIKVSDAVEAVFGVIAEKEEQLNCYITLDKEKAMERATQVQAQMDAGVLTAPLAGVPFAIKDNLCTRGIRTTCGSKMLEDFVPSYSAEAVTMLEKAGAVIIGKTNMDEFAMGSTTETSYYGATRNPHNMGHVPGGSSGGSAAAVAAGECFAALGSDTGGSVRLPAAYCGVVGMKPTYGTVSRYGLVAYASSLDQIGVITKDVTDCAAVLEAIASYDAKDSTSVKRQDTDFASGLTGDIEGMRIGIPGEYLGAGLAEEVREAVLEAAEVFRDCGALVEEFDLGLAEYAVPAYYTIAAAEASSNLGRFDGIKYGYRAESAENLDLLYKKSRSEAFGAEVKRRIMLGSFVLSAGYYDAYYLKALRVRTLLKRAFDRAFAKYDLILGPTAPAAAPKLGESLEDPVRMYQGDIYTVPANLAGLPAISLPTGILPTGILPEGILPEKSHAPDGHSKLLPIGIQLMGDCFQEKKLLGAAYALSHH